MTNSYLFDIEGAGKWKVRVDDGKVSVSEGGDDADAVLAASLSRRDRADGQRQLVLGAELDRARPDRVCPLVRHRRGLPGPRKRPHRPGDRERGPKLPGGSSLDPQDPDRLARRAGRPP